MNRMATRLLERVFVKVHIRSAWNKLHTMTEHGELASALETLIRLTSTDSSYCELIGVMVDMISTDSLGITAPFLCHIIDMAALPSQQTTRRLSQQLLSKCDQGTGIARLRSKKKNKPAAALIWSVLANRLAGEMCLTLFSDAVCDCLLNNIENDPDMSCKVFSIIALEKFSLTGPCKAKIMQTNIRELLKKTAEMTWIGVAMDWEELSGLLQAKFCAAWALRNIFRDVAEDGKSVMSLSQSEDENLAQLQDSLSPSSAANSPNSSRASTSPRSSATTATTSTKASTTSNINVMLNTLDGTRHWKISEDGLTIRNDGTMFESIRATVSVRQGKWFYEVTLITAGIMQLGWATVHCHFSPEEGTGVGDDIFGFAYDGCRNLIWADGDSEVYGESESWKPGDVLGVYLDVDNAVLECFMNGKSLGTVSPFEKDDFAIQAVSGFYPALSCTSFQQATVNFGAKPFKYPPSLPWRNLNNHGSITQETREAIIRPRNDSVYGRIQLDPVTGVRLASMPEDDSEIDYSLLCTICCDHTATVTLQPCGHDGLCVECAYSLDMCPLCRSRIFQRQMFPTTDTSKDSQASNGGLGVSGSSETSDSSGSGANTFVPGLSASSSTVTSAWSASEYCGPAPSNPNHVSLPSLGPFPVTSLECPFSTLSSSSSSVDSYSKPQQSTAEVVAAATALVAAAAAASAHPRNRDRSHAHTHSDSHNQNHFQNQRQNREWNGSSESLSSRRRNTLAAPYASNPSTLNTGTSLAPQAGASLPPATSASITGVTATTSFSASPSTNRLTALEQDCLANPFSPPSTTYFAFLNRPAAATRARSHLQHPFDMDGEAAENGEVAEDADTDLFRAPALDPLEAVPLRRVAQRPFSQEQLQGQGLVGAPSAGVGSGLGLGLDFGSSASAFSENSDAAMAAVVEPSYVVDEEEEEEEMDDEDLIEEGREALDREVMEQSAPDFITDGGGGHGHSVIHSRRNSIQILASLPPLGLGAVGGGFTNQQDVGGGAGVMSAEAMSAALNEIASDCEAAAASASASAAGLGAAAGAGGGLMGVGNANASGLPPVMGIGMSTNAGTARFGGRRASMPSNRLEM